MKRRITDKTVKALKSQAKPYEVRDDSLTGFLLRIQPAGTMTYYVEYRNATGKKQRIKLGSHPALSVPKARDLAVAKMAEVVLGADPALEKRESRNNLTLREFLDAHYAPWARANLKSHFQTLKKLYGGFRPLLDKRLQDLTPFDFEKNRLARLKGRRQDDGSVKVPKAATVNRDQMTLRAALSKARQWGMIESNPLDGVKRSREDRNASIRAMTRAEEARVLAYFQAQRDALEAKRTAARQKGKNFPPIPAFLSYVEPCIIVSLDTGIRQGEAAQLRWADIDFAAAALTVRGEGSKSAQTRTIPLTDRAIDTLTAWRNQNPDTERVFHELTPSSIKRQWGNVCRATGIEKLRWHDLRHTYASRIAQAGAGVMTIKALLGHSSIVTSQRYIHADADDLRRAVAALGKAQQTKIVPLDRAEGGAE